MTVPAPPGPPAGPDLSIVVPVYRSEDCLEALAVAIQHREMALLLDRTAGLALGH